MATLSFFKNKTGNYYLTKVMVDDNEKDITLPDYITKDDVNYTYGIFKYAFNQITLTDLIIPKTVQAINEYAFMNSNIQNIHLYHKEPPKISTVRLTFVSDNNNLNIIVPKNYKEVYTQQNWLDINDKNMKINIIEADSMRPDEEEIGDTIPSFFGFKESFSKIKIGKQVKEIEDMAFLDIIDNSEEKPLFEIDDAESKKNYNIVNEGLLEVKDNNNILIKGLQTAYNNEIGSYIVNQAILGPNSFSNHVSQTLNNLIFTGKRIEGLAFQGCVNLKTLTLNGDIEYISPDAFIGCKQLNKIILQTSQSSNGQYTVVEKGISQYLIHTQNNIKELIWSYAQLELEESGKDTMYTLLKDKEISAISSCFITNTENFLKGDVTSLTIPPCVEYIGKDAFRGLGLTSITFDEGDKPLIIDHSAFRQNKITSITFGNRPIIIGSYAFASNELIGDIELPQTIIETKKGIFQNNQDIKKITYYSNLKIHNDDYHFGVAKAIIEEEVEIIE